MSSPRVRLALLAALLACGCDRDDQAARLRGEKQLLERQTAGLEELVAAAEKGNLIGPEQLLIGIDEATVEGLIGATLPQERLVAGRVRVRLDKAEVQFRHSQGVVVLQGRASLRRSPDTFAEVELEGGLDEIQIRPGRGTLVGRVAAYHLEVRRASAAGAEGAAIRELAETLGRERMESLSELVPPLEIPIRLEESVSFDGLDEGPVSARPGTLPVRVAITRVVALSGRLWVALDASVGPWRERPPS